MHCVVDSSVSCSDKSITKSDILSIGPYVISSNQVTAQWKGWVDAPGGSGIDAYHLDVYHVVEKGPTHLQEQIGGVHHFSLSNSSNNQSFDLPAQGLYSVVLKVLDATANARLARRFVLYVRNSTPAIDSLFPIQFPLSVTTVSGFKWQIVDNNEVSVDWTGHFFTSFIRKNPLLKPIASFYLPIVSQYDQPAVTLQVGGVAVTVDPLTGIKSFDGIVAVKYAVQYGHVPKQPSNDTYQLIVDKSLSHVLQQSFIIKTPTRDGDNMFIWLKAIDIFGNSINDAALLNVDSSKPEIDHLWLTKDGVSQLTFLNTTQFHLLQFDFVADDPHSSLTKSSWSLKETLIGKSSLGSGKIKVKPPSNVRPNKVRVIAGINFFSSV